MISGFRALGFEILPLAAGLPFGARVAGLRAEHLENPVARRALYDVWIDRGVIHFHGGDDSQEFHLALSECFGPHQRHVFEEALVDGHPELTRVRYFPDDGSIYEVGGRRLGAWIPWHSDLKYTDRINRGGILRPLQLPKSGGGMTGFIDLISAYDRLPDRLKQRIEDLHVVYVMDINQARQRFGVREDVHLIRFTESASAIMSRQFQYPRVLHPMVYLQRETGRKVLNVSPWFAIGIYELGGPDGDALLEEILDYCIDDASAYYHDWREGDMVLWDNWRALHSCTGIDPGETRVMQRTTLAGDYALGRKLEEGGAARSFDV